MPLISVIIPAYNAEKTIQETIESVINQSFSDWELIVVNDGSQDRTVEVVDQIKDPRIKVFSYPNTGVSASRNRGFDKSVGEFISFLDADDLWTPDKLESQLNALCSHPEVAVAYSWTDYIDESGHFLFPGQHATLNGKIYSQILVKFFLENGSNMLVRREAFLKVGGFKEALFMGEDWECCISLAKEYEFVAVPRPQILYRQSTGTASDNVYKYEQECLKVIESIFSDAPASLQHLKKHSLAHNYKYLACKTINSQPTPKKGLAVMKFILLYALNDPYLKSNFKLMFTIFVKSLGFIFLPPAIYQNLLGSVKSIKLKD
ncbi:glycosyltransferase [Dapis sp. BLCC M126]|uniref:glycosyltransferase n=1 Tax=Dapis sp. BLCC M126 TaxID=3400189 RepID=UPI003CEF2F01